MEDESDVELDCKGKRYMYDDGDDSYYMSTGFYYLKYIPYSMRKPTTKSNILTSPYPSFVYKGKLPPHQIEKFGIFTLEELAIATDNFHRYLGYGNSGYMFQGEIGKKVVAIKLFKDKDPRDREYYDSYTSEVEVMQITDHPHIVRMIGYCNEERKKLLVYEFVRGHSLLQWLANMQINTKFSFIRRMKVLVGVCEALFYLHHHKNRIVHGDLNVYNVLVERYTFYPIVTGFGMSRYLFTQSCHRERDIVGFPRIKDPLFIETKCSSLMNDIYSFGIILLGTIAGKAHEIHVLVTKWASSIPEGAHEMVADGNLNGDYPIAEMLKLFDLARRCVCETAHLRPKINEILTIIREIHDNTRAWDDKKKGVQSCNQAMEDQGSGSKNIPEQQPKKIGKLKKIVHKVKDLFK